MAYDVEEFSQLRQALSGRLSPAAPPSAPDTPGPLHQRLQGALAGVSVDPRPSVPATGTLERLMAAIAAKESGGGVLGRKDYNVVNPIGARGAYQFMPGTWKGAAPKAGVDVNDWSPAAQDKVARYLMGSYLDQYKDPAKVAMAWYGGPGAVNDPSRWDKGQGKYPTIRSYADTILKLMG